MSFFKKAFLNLFETPNLNEVPLVILTKYPILFLISILITVYNYMFICLVILLTSVVPSRWKSSTKTQTISLCSPLLNWYK